MAVATTPLPRTDPVSKPYWDSLRAHRMELQRCDGCGRFVFYPRPLCPHCLCDRLTWTPVSGRGVVHAFTIPHFHANEAFRAQVPYVVALVELAEGARMLSTLVGVKADPADVTVGMDVEVVYDDVTPEMTLPRFRPC